MELNRLRIGVHWWQGKGPSPLRHSPARADDGVVPFVDEKNDRIFEGGVVQKTLESCFR